MRNGKSAERDSAPSVWPKRSRFHKLEIVLLLTLLGAVAGCSGESPTSPDAGNVPPRDVPSQMGHIYGTVWIFDLQGCLVVATIEVLDGPQAGQKVQQSAEDCGRQDGSPTVFSFHLKDLPTDATVRIRASMPGFQSAEKSVRPLPKILHLTDFVDFHLVRTP